MYAVDLLLTLSKWGSRGKNLLFMYLCNIFMWCQKFKASNNTRTFSMLYSTVVMIVASWILFHFDGNEIIVKFLLTPTFPFVDEMSVEIYLPTCYWQIFYYYYIFFFFCFLDYKNCEAKCIYFVFLLKFWFCSHVFRLYDLLTLTSVITSNKWFSAIMFPD